MPRSVSRASVSILRPRCGAVAGALAVLLTAHVAVAQVVPGAADPARVAPIMNNPSTKFEKLRDQSGDKMPSTSLIQIPAGAEKIRFTLQSLNVEGAHAYGPEQLEPLYRAHVGKEITLATLYGIANQLQRKYLDDGYTLSKVIVPEQDLRSGRVKLQVIEGHVTQVEIDPQLEDTAALRDAVVRIKAMQPLNTLVLERILLILNDLPDTQVSAILATLKDPQPDENTPGSVRMILQKNTKQLPRGRISTDNYGSVFSGPWQGIASAHVYDLGIENSDLSVAFSSAAPYEEQHYGSVNYSMPLFGASGTKLTLGGVWARTQPGDTLEILEIRGKTESFSANVAYPILRQRAGTWTVDAGVEAKNAHTDLLGSELYNDNLRIVNAGTNYNFSDNWEGFNAVDLHYSRGLDMLGASKAGAANLSRADGKADFEKVNFYAGRVQTLPADFELYALVSGQYAFNPLLSAEEFGFGGGQVGRGYDPSEMTGDHGVSGTVELRYNTDFHPLEQQLAVQPYVFYDAGKIWNIDSGAHDQLSATSAGGGARMVLNNTWNGNLLAAVPLTKRADNPPHYATSTGARFLFSLSRSF